MTPFDPFAPEVRADPYPHYARLRAADPVHRSARGAWVVTRHADVAALLAHPDVSHWPPAAGDAGGTFERIVGRWLGLMAPGGRSRLRALTARALGPARMEALAPTVEQWADALLAWTCGRAAFDLVADFAEPLSLAVVAHLLGVPDDEGGRFASLARPLQGSFFLLLGGRRPPAALDEAARAFSEYLLDLLGRKQGRRGDDLLSALIAAEEEDGLDREDFVALALVFLFAGHENVTSLIGNGAWTLLRHPDHAQRLRAEPGLMPPAVEELMRLESPVQYVSLTPRRDLEVGEKTLGAGDQVLACIGAANRDPAVFADPDAMLPGRSPNPHLALGHGPFFCIGGTLARMQARAALSALLRLSPGLRLAPVPPQWRDAPPVLRGLRELRVLPPAAPRPPLREAV